MKTIEEITDILIEDKNLLFYKIMNYPIPREKELFSLKKREVSRKPEANNLFSWTQKNQTLKEYIKIINRYWRLYRSIPFIKHIYLCNSITFNATNEDSDIDIFIITKEKALRRARFFSWIFFSVLFLKRWKINKKKKFCLSFYTTIDNTNLYNISLPKSDIYLVYRIAHLVPLYQEEKYNIYSDNSWIYSYLPNLPQNHNINIWTKKINWKSSTKKLLEKIFWWYFWKFFEHLIKTIRLPIIIHKKNKLWKKWRWIIINNKMLKFHQDIRKKIYASFKTQK